MTTKIMQRVPALRRMLFIVLFFIGLAGQIGQSHADNFDRAMDAIENQKYDHAVELLVPLAEQDHLFAQYILGLVLYHGEGVSPDPEQGLKWLMRAAQRGFPAAQLEVGRHFMRGGSPDTPYRRPDGKEALKWFKRAANNGEPEAQLAMGGALSTGGRGILVDYVEAYYWLSVARLNGEKKASFLRNSIAKYVSEDDRKAQEKRAETIVPPRGGSE